MMGSNTSNNENEKPAKKVHVSAFAIGAFEITHDQFNVFYRDENTSQGSKVDAVTRPTAQYIDLSWNMGKDGGYPVNSMSVDAAMMFCRWIYSKTGIFYRLPTEAEWEYAAKAGTGTPWYWPEGETAALDYAWFADNSGHQTHPVGQKKPNAFGLFDMAGNVWEWTKDNWHDNYQGAPSDGSVWGDADVPTQVLRGGSWYNPVRDVRSTLRYSTEPDYRWTTLGFRLALSQK